MPRSISIPSVIEGTVTEQVLYIPDPSEAVAVTEALPEPTAKTLPSASTVATFSSDEEYVTMRSEAFTGSVTGYSVMPSPTLSVTSVTDKVTSLTGIADDLTSRTGRIQYFSVRNAATVVMSRAMEMLHA